MRSFYRRRTAGEKVFDTCNIIFMLLICFVTLYPFWNVLVLSFSEGVDASMSSVTFWTKDFTLKNYSSIFREGRVLTSFLFSVRMVLVNTALSVLVTAMAAYGLSKNFLPGRKFMGILLLITTWFHGGLIPTFMTYRYYHLLNNFWVYILPNLIVFYNFMIMREYFRTLPESVEESAIIDGAGVFKTFIYIVLPMSTPVIATVCLFESVQAWNNWMTSLIYCYKEEKLWTLQFFLQRVLREASDIEKMMHAAQMDGTYRQGMEEQIKITPQSIRAAITIVATLPIALVYPFVQKYFVTGIKLGAVKG